MINNLWNIGKTAMQNAQVSINNAANNAANAAKPGYQRTTAVYETRRSITSGGLTVGTGATVSSIQSEWNKFVEAQYLNAYADLNAQSSSMDYLKQLNALFNQSKGGLSDLFENFASLWNKLTSAPDSGATREDLLGKTDTLVYGLNSTAQKLEQTVNAINTEIENQVNKANQLIKDLGAANEAIAANPEDNQAISNRDQKIRELDALIGVNVLHQANGQDTILTKEGMPLVEGSTTHSLVYGKDQVVNSLKRDSNYNGTIEYSGTSSEELLLEFTSTGPDGTAQFKVSTDGGKTWKQDDSGNTKLYTADSQNEAVEVEGVKIWFHGATADHTEGDRYSIMPKSGLYWKDGDGGLVNITTLTDDRGQNIAGRTSSGSLAGLFNTRDDTVVPTLDDLDALSEALIWEVNKAHSQGAGLEHHTSLTGSYSVSNAAAILSKSGLDFADNIQAGDLKLVTYNADGTVSSSSVISIDPTSDSLDDVVNNINAAFSGELTASVTAEGKLQISAAASKKFEIAGDSSNLMAATGVNTYFSGNSAATVAVDSYVATHKSHINSGVVGDDNMVASGSNEIASILAKLSSQTVTVGGSQTSMSKYLASIVSNVGSATSQTELRQTYAQTSAKYLYDQQASGSEVNVDEELLELDKYQQAFKAASQIITMTQKMMDTVLGMV